MVQYGKTDWKEKNYNSGNKINYKEKFLKLSNGKNIVRFLTDPYKYMVHKIKFTGDPNQYGRNIRCSLEDCPLCDGDYPRAKPKYIVPLVVRKT